MLKICILHIRAILHAQDRNSISEMTFGQLLRQAERPARRESASRDLTPPGDQAVALSRYGRIPSLMRACLQPVSLDESRQGAAIDIEDPRDCGIGDLLRQQLLDNLFLPGELGLLGIAPLRPAQLLPLALLPGQRFLRA